MTIYSIRQPMHSISEQNERVLHEFRNGSVIDLPHMFLVYRRNGTDPNITESNKWNAVLISTRRAHLPVHSHNHPYIWEFTITDSPSEFLNTGILLRNQTIQDTWCFGQTHRIIVKRSSRNPVKDGKYIPIELSYGGSYVLLDNHRIPVFSLTEPTICLSSTFKRLDQPEYSQWCLKLEPYMPIISPSELHRVQRRQIRNQQHTITPPIILPIQPTQTQSRMPQHIVNSYIDSSISREETCPISMTPLSRETACLTPCGHLSARHEAERWIQGAHSCPVCRSPCSVDGLQSWRQ